MSAGDTRSKAGSPTTEQRMREPEAGIPPVGAIVYWKEERYVWRGTVAGWRPGRSRGATMLILSDVRVKRLGGKNWYRERAALGMTKNARHVETEEPRGVF